MIFELVIFFRKKNKSKIKNDSFYHLSTSPLIYMKQIVVMAHNQKKPELVAFLKEREEWLWGRTLIATGRSAQAVEKAEIDVRLHHLSPGKSGGYNEITELITTGKVDMVIFFQDREIQEQHHIDIRNLLDACNTSNIPLATNPASAELLIIGLIRKEYAEKQKV